MSTLYTPFSKSLFTYMAGEHPQGRTPWGGVPSALRIIPNADHPGCGSSQGQGFSSRERLGCGGSWTGEGGRESRSGELEGGRV